MKIVFLVSFICAILFSKITFASDEVSSSKIPVPTGKYIAGGIVGSTVGFGIGHAIEGRYGQKGWIFTAGEASGLALLLGAAAECSNRNQKDTNGDLDCGGQPASQAALGLAAMIGFRIWEVIDVWTGATPVEEKTSAFIIPTPTEVKAGLVYRF